MYSVISRKILLYFFLMSCIIGCNSETKNSRLLFEILQESKEPIIKKVLSDLNSHEVQILFTRIHRDSLGVPKFERHTFQVNSKQYFYPASTVKFPYSNSCSSENKKASITRNTY